MTTVKARWIGPYAPTDRHADQITMQELVRLRKDNSRYKDALEKIAKPEGTDSQQAYIMKIIATNALKGE